MKLIVRDFTIPALSSLAQPQCSIGTCINEEDIAVDVPRPSYGNNPVILPSIIDSDPHDSTSIEQAADNKSDDISSLGSPDSPPSITDSDPSPFGSPCTQTPPSKTDLDSDPRPNDDIVQDCSSAGTKCIQSEELSDIVGLDVDATAYSLDSHTRRHRNSDTALQGDQLIEYLTSANEVLTEKVNLYHRKYYDAEEKLLNEQEKCKKKLLLYNGSTET